MFGPITVSFGTKILCNTITLKPGVTVEEVEMAVAELCAVVKGVYGGENALSRSAPISDEITYRLFHSN